MIVVNFAHPLTADQRARIEAIVGTSVDRVVEVQAHFDHAAPFGPQARELVDQAGLDSAGWQHESLVLVAPSLSSIGCVVLAEVHGRCGYFPPLVRLAPRAGAVPPRFDVVEIIDLANQRQEARGRRLAG